MYTFRFEVKHCCTTTKPWITHITPPSTAPVHWLPGNHNALRGSTVSSTAPVRWPPGNQHALRRSTVVAVVGPRSCVALLSLWRRLYRRSCAHRGRGTMVYCTAGTLPLKTHAERHTLRLGTDTTRDFHCLGETHLTSDAGKQRALCKLLSSWHLQSCSANRHCQGVPQRGLCLTHGLAATSLMRG